MIRDFFETGLLKKLPYSPYSPDISPSDFYLFGNVNGALVRQEVPDEVGLLEAISAILSGISHDELPAVFRNWIELVQEVIDADDCYVS
jgi:hypothetical protein